MWDVSSGIHSSGIFCNLRLSGIHWSDTAPFSAQDKDSMLQVLRAVDKANGYCFGDMEERNLQAMMSAAVGADFQFDLYPFSVVTMTHPDSSCLDSRNFQLYER